MSRKYKPQWFESAFGHAKYTLIRELKDCKHIDIDKNLISLGSGNASTNFIIDEHGQSLIIVYMPYTDVPLISQQGLIIHEAVHIWQEIKNRMREDEPSIEFEAYSIQVISQDLLWLLGESNGRMAQPPT